MHKAAMTSLATDLGDLITCFPRGLYKISEASDSGASQSQ